MIIRGFGWVRFKVSSLGLGFGLGLLKRKQIGVRMHSEGFLFRSGDCEHVCVSWVLLIDVVDVMFKYGILVKVTVGMGFVFVGVG
eukprot:1363372-Amorphochlora_amoeboformis.AAC.1